MSTQVLNRFHPVLIDHAFAANTGKLNIPVDHIEELEIGWTYMQNGSTDPVIADLKGDFIDELVMTLGGIEYVRLDMYDICHMQNLWFGQTPHFIISTDDNCYGYFAPVTLPLSLDLKDPAGNQRSHDMQLTIGALTDVDNCVVQAGVKYISNQNVSWLPNGMHYAYQYKVFTASTTRRTVEFDRAGADLIGLLVFNEHVPLNTSATNDIDNLTILVNDQPVFGPIYWENIPTFKTTQSAADDAFYGDELEHYRYLDFSRAPLPADNMDIWTNSTVGTGTNNRFIGIYQEP